MSVELGQWVEARQVVALVGDAVGAVERSIRANSSGIVIGRNEMPIVHRGDALVHIGEEEPETVDTSTPGS